MCHISLRSSGRIKRRISDGANLAARNGAVRKKAEFLWRPGHEEVAPRDRSHLPPTSRDVTQLESNYIERTNRADALWPVPGAGTDRFAAQHSSHAIDRGLELAAKLHKVSQQDTALGYTGSVQAHSQWNGSCGFSIQEVGLSRPPPLFRADNDFTSFAVRTAIGRRATR